MTGKFFEAEIREQPAVWRRLAESAAGPRLARAIRGRDVLLLGSGSSLYAAQLGAFALRRRGVRAQALAAGEAPLDNAAYRNTVVVACSQSGESDDVLAALDALQPATIIAVTNGATSSLAQRAGNVFDVEAGPELAVPASKSVTATAAALLWAADACAGESSDRAADLLEAAGRVAAWLAGAGVDAVRDAAGRIASRRSVIVVGTGYGLPVAREAALKLKEASYVHAEGFAAGEFVHGSAAMLDASCAVVGIVDDLSHHVVERAMRAALQAGSARYVIGDPLEGLSPLGPSVDGPFAPLARIVTAQMLALFTGRARNVDSDSPRGQSKILFDK